MIRERRLSYSDASRYLARLDLTGDRYVSREWARTGELADLAALDPLADRPQLDTDPYTRRVAVTDLGAEALVCLWRVRRPGLMHTLWRRWSYVVVHVSNPFGHCRSWVSVSRREAELRYDTLATRVVPHLSDLPLFGAPIGDREA